MAKINVGDLICMYRRKKKGMGIVLEKADDIIESLFVIQWALLGTQTKERICKNPVV